MIPINNSTVADPTIRSLTLLDKENVALFLTKILETGTPISIGFINQHAYNLIHLHSDIKHYFESLDYRLRDGAGIKIACHYHDCDPGVNLNGTDFIPLLINHLLERKKQGVRFFVFGTEEPWLSKGAMALLKGAPVTMYNGFEKDDIYLNTVLNNADDASLTVIVLAMGMPKQERISQQLINALSGPVIIICGGAIIDFYAGRVSRAPYLFRKLGLEWFYRLSIEPKRLFERYVIGIPKFFYLLIKNKKASAP
jgi:beta-1,4-glucosyltransferase